MHKNTYVISVGGSLISPQSGIDCDFLKEFRRLILNEIKKGKKFYIVSGGGATARNYINSCSKVTRVNNEDKDWMGIHATRLNAHLLRTIFRDTAHPKIMKDPTAEILGTEKIFIASGWKPGWSTDYVATILAKKYKVETIINLSNIDYVYNKDPRKYKNAVPFKNMSWNEFRKMVGNKWDPGLNAPFDPVASKLAQESGLKVVIMDGKNMGELKDYLMGKEFKGTVIAN